MIFDTHAHYYDGAFDPDPGRTCLRPSPPWGWPWCSPRRDLESSRASIALAEKFGYLYAAVGFHPENLEGASLDQLDQVRTMSAHPKVKAIGEIGLDYYWVKTPEARAFSRDFFDAQLSLAEELDLPAVVHDRDAHRDCLDIVRAPPWLPGGCSTAIRAASRMRRYCWIGAGCSPLPGTSPLPMPGVAPRW